MRTKQNNYSLLKNKRQLGLYPIELIKQVDKPTNLITDQWQRIDSREIAFFKAAKGEYGPAVQASADE